MLRLDSTQQTANKRLSNQCYNWQMFTSTQQQQLALIWVLKDQLTPNTVPHNNPQTVACTLLTPAVYLCAEMPAHTDRLNTWNSVNTHLLNVPLLLWHIRLSWASSNSQIVPYLSLPPTPQSSNCLYYEQSNKSEK